MSQANLPAIDQLKKAVIDQKKVSLPFEPPAPELEELHEAVLAYDQAVSQIVIRAIQGWQGTEDLPEVELAKARERVTDAMAGDRLQNSRTLEIYRNYVQRLDRMIELARQTKLSAGH